MHSPEVVTRVHPDELAARSEAGRIRALSLSAPDGIAER